MLPIVTLSSWGYEADICPSRGANLTRLTRPDLGIDALRTPVSQADFEKRNCFLWGIPILFPPNRISNARFCFEGRTYRWPVNEPATGHFLHGAIHQTPFTLLSHTPEQACLLYRATREEPYGSFPHSFSMKVTYTLATDGLHQTITIRNESQDNMPVALGFHTTFRLPFDLAGTKECIALQLSVGREVVRDMDTYLPTGELLEDYDLRKALLYGSFHPAEHAVSRHFEMIKPRRMLLIDHSTGARITYMSSASYRYWMLYGGGGSEYLCVEPQTWINNCPNAPFDRMKTGFAWLSPGEQREDYTIIRLDKI